MSSGVALDVILKAGQWSADSSFYTFYLKDVIQSGNLVDIAFADSLIKTLQHFNSSVVYILLCFFMIPHKDIINIVHVVFTRPAAMKKLFILPVSLMHFKISFMHISQDVIRRIGNICQRFVNKNK